MSRYILMFLCLAAPVVVLAQDVTGSISGSVTDPAGAVIVGRDRQARLRRDRRCVDSNHGPRRQFHLYRR